MTALDTIKTQYTDRIVPALPPSVRSILSGNSRKQLLNQVAHRLVLMGGNLIHIESGQLHAVSENPSASEIASAAKGLLGSSSDTPCALYLPPADFVSTSVDMPGVSRENLLSALKLQSENLFPSYERSLALTLGSHGSNSESNNVALWYPEDEMNELFAAFSSSGLFLTAIAPRNLIDCSLAVVSDYDEKGGTLVQLNDETLSSWIHISALDLHDEELNQQWNTENQNAGDAAVILDGSASFRQFRDCTISQDYAFIPSGAMQARKKVEKGRNLGFAAAAVVLLMVFSSIPFLLQSLEFRSLASTLASHREQSTQAREDQSVVVGFENEWGAITDFPIQDVQDAMFTLQSVLLPDQLASLEVSEGLIRIQGTSTEPQAILQRLEQHPMFTEVVFSRATNNSRYYIDLYLSTVNFEAYMVRYFPDE